MDGIRKAAASAASVPAVRVMGAVVLFIGWAADAINDLAEG
ncbi:hypothetical protein [Azospirillum oleiclasticum]|nr:hypothetical protein [Azospirillum oleiclasticum]